MTVYAKLILESIALGMRLRIPHRVAGAATDASLVDAFYDFGRPHTGNKTVDDSWRQSHIRPAIGPLDPEPVAELLASGLLWKLTKDRVDERFGWMERGLDGKKADFYCLVQ